VQRRHTQALLEIPGVIGTAVTGLPNGRASLLILTERSGISGIPFELDGVPVTEQVTGRIMRVSDPTQRKRPAPLGYSVGHPAITAGNDPARASVTRSAACNILSNNHVLANSNGATSGDPTYQPGPFDGGTAAAIRSPRSAISRRFSSRAPITRSTRRSRCPAWRCSTNAVPSDDGYGMPNSTIYGDANGDGLFDNRDRVARAQRAEVRAGPPSSRTVRSTRRERDGLGVLRSDRLHLHEDRPVRRSADHFPGWIQQWRTTPARSS
jgi:hypothetical protein